MVTDLLAATEDVVEATDPVEVADAIAAAFHAVASRLAPEFGWSVGAPVGDWSACPVAYRLWLRAACARLIDAGFVVTPERAAVLAAADAVRSRPEQLAVLDAALAAWDAAMLGPSASCRELAARSDWASVEMVGLA